MEINGKPKYIPTLLSIWCIIAIIQFWFSSVLSTHSTAAAFGDAVGYTFVPIAAGFFLLRRAETKKGLINRSIIILGCFFVMLWGEMRSNNANFIAQLDAECSGSTNLVSLTQPQKAEYCECFVSGALPIIKRAARRAALAVTTGNPMEDQVFVNEMQSSATSCSLPTE